jgi:hypothetical protein
MAGLLDGIDPQTALLLGLGSGLLGTSGQGRRASFGEALANGMQQGTQGYRQAISDRQRAEQLAAEQIMRQQQMRLQQEESARAQGRYGMDQQAFADQRAEAQRKQQQSEQMRDLARRFALNTGPTLESGPEPVAGGFDRQGYAQALEAVDPMAGLQYQSMIAKGDEGENLPEGAIRVNRRTGAVIASNPKAATPTDAGRKLAELEALGYPKHVAQGIAYGMLEVVPDGNGGTAIVHKAQALQSMGQQQPQQQPAPMQPGAATAPQRGPFDAPPPMPGQIGGNPGVNNVRARLGAEENLRKEFTALPTVKAYSQAFPAYQNVLSAASRDNPQADISLVYGVAKLYDPESVVREGEYGTISNSQAIPERIKGYANFLMGGGRLTAETRKQLIAEAESRHGVLRQGYEQSAGQYTELARKSGVDPSTVITSFGQPKAAPERLKTISKSDVDAIVREAFALGKTRAQVLQKLQDEGYAIPLK